jgi:hypothetical protein
MCPRSQDDIFLPLVRDGGHELEVREWGQPMCLLRKECGHFLGDECRFDPDVYSEQAIQPAGPGFSHNDDSCGTYDREYSLSNDDRGYSGW